MAEKSQATFELSQQASSKQLCQQKKCRLVKLNVFIGIFTGAKFGSHITLKIQEKC